MIGARKQTRRSQVMAEINITPFTDVVLVLLIIFMVSASFMGSQRALSVNLPSARNSEPVRQKQNVNVTIDAKGQVYLDGNPWSVDDMSKELKARNDQKPVDMVIVRADKGVQYEKVVRVMDAVKQAGIENIAFPTKVPGVTDK
jgi:biopolymer transport protein ExbD